MAATTVWNCLRLRVIGILGKAGRNGRVG
jgi:hypothetical protein